MLKYLKSKLPRGQFARGVAMLAGSSALAQALAALSSPILTRIYSPGDMGVLAVFTGLLAVGNGFASLRYDSAIPIPKRSEDSAKLLALSLAILPITGIALLAAVLLFGKGLAVAARVPEVAPYLWMLPVGLLLIGAYQSMSFWFVREARFNVVASTRLVQVVNLTVVQVAGGLVFGGPWMLICGNIAGQMAGIGAFWRLLRREYRPLFGEVTLKSVAEIGREYKKFPLLTSWSQMINAAGLQAPTMLLASLYGMQTAGWYALGQRVIGMPMDTIGRSIMQVYWCEAAKLANENPSALPGRFFWVSKKLAMVAVPIGLLSLASPWIFPAVFGAKWYMAGVYAAVLAAPLVASSISSPTSNLTTFGFNAWMSCWEVSRFVLVTGTILTCYHLRVSVTMTIVWLSASSTVACIALYILNTIAVYRVAGRAKSESTAASDGASDPQSIAFGGDVFLGGDIQSRGAALDVPAFASADVRIINLEQAIADCDAVEHKCTLYTGSRALSDLLKLDVHAVGLANNHIQDKTDAGIVETLDHLDRAGIAHFGTGANIEDAGRPHWVTPKLAILAYCQGNRPYLRNVRSAGADSPGVNPLEMERVLGDLEKLPEGTGAILYIHWGREHVWLPPYENLAMARKLLRHEKVKAIVGMHAHRVQGTLSYRGKRAYFCLGNFLFPNFYIDPDPKHPQITYPAQEPADVMVTRRYHRVSALTYKKWAFANRVSLVARLDVASGRWSHYPVLQDDNEPVVRQLGAVGSIIVNAWVSLLSLPLHLPKPLYVPLERLEAKLSSLHWQAANFIFCIRQEGMRRGLRKITGRLIPSRR